MLPLLPLIYYYNFDVKVGGEEQPPKSSDAFVDGGEQASPTESVANSGQKMSESDEEEESPQGEPNEPEVLPLLYCVLPLLQLLYYYNFIVQVGGKEQPPKSSDAFVDVEEQTSPTKSVTNPRQKMNESAEEEESPQGVPNDRNVARQPEVLPL